MKLAFDFRKPRRMFPLLLMLALVAPLAGQEKEVYFALSSSRTYAPGEKPQVSISVQNVNSLEFRLYRVNDPIKFFQQLDEPNRFGGRAARLPRVRGPLEAFSAWKRGWRFSIRDFVRAQFSDESRGQIRAWLRGKPEKPAARPVPPGTEFAQAPVLNPQQLVRKWQQTIPKTQYAWQEAQIPVEVPGKGLYVVEAVHKDLRAFTVLNVTELGLIAKVWPGRVLVFAQQRVTGAAVAKLPVIIWEGKRELAAMTADAQGVAEAAISEPKPEETVILARSGDDFAVASLSAWSLNSDPQRNLTGYIYTDRPVYRPGHTVSYRAILRTQIGAGYEIPAGRDVEVEVTDDEGNTVHRRKTSLSANGSLSGEFTLAATAPLGYYSLNIKSGEATEYGSFQVEEYKKPEYEVRVRPQARRALQGQPIRATLEARYYFGEPVGGAKVTYVVHVGRAWPPWFGGDDVDTTVDDEDDRGGYYGGEQILEETAQLDAEGRVTVTIPTKVNDKKFDQVYRIEARVTDESNREISGNSSVTATYGSFFLRIWPAQYVYAPGTRGKFNIEARDYDGKPVEAALRVELFPWSWREPDKDKAKPPIASSEARADANGRASVELPLAEGGSYRARVASRTPEGREVQDDTYVWVSGGMQWGSDEDESMQIVPDKKSYKPGETARVLITGSVAKAAVLVTTEGRVLHSKQVVTPNESSFTVEIPIRGEFAPNFYINAAFLHDNRLRTGAKSIKVNADEHKLNLKIETAKKEFQPGEPARYTLTATDAAGKGVAGAELSLGVVDEAIYAIRPESARDIFGFFYGNVWNRVNTDSSLSFYFHGEAGKRAIQMAVNVEASRERGGAPAAQLKPEKLVQPKVRKAFPDTAFWAADLTTDSSGRATAQFSFPDSLTTWRATSRGVTRDTKVGSAVERTIVRKNMILRLAVPRFFREGDEATVANLVHNYLATEKTARVSLDVQGLDVLSGATADVRIPSRGDAKAEWRVRPRAGANAVLTGKALTNQESDAMELTLPIVPFGVKQAIARSGSVSNASAEFDADVTFPAAISPMSRKLEITASPSLAGALLGAMEYLTAFPYGCTEQTMSSFLPNVMVAHALRELGVKSDVDEAALKKKIAAGLERLKDYQHEDGGWGWWKTDESQAFMTAYVVSGLAQARAAGVNINEYDLDRARDWLRKEFDAQPKALPDLRAYLAYAIVLGGKSDAKLIEAVWQHRKEMTAQGRALLGLALAEAGDTTRAAELAKALEAEAQQNDEEVWWSTPERDWLLDFDGDSSPESTAYAVKLISRFNPQSPLLPKAVVWLLRNRRNGYYWESTKQTALVIYGLTDYLKASGQLKPDFRVSVSVNRKPVLQQKFTADDALAPKPPSITLTADQLAAGANKIHITKSGSGQLYWSVRGEFFSTEEKSAGAGSADLNVIREYFRLVPAHEGEKIVHRLEPFNGTASPGDVLAVRLTVSAAKSWRYLLIEDPIPAGTEFIERDQLYEIKERPPWWRFWWWTRREFRDDRAVFFETYFGRGQQQYVYLLKVVLPGTYRVSPARVEPMYQPRVSATSDSRTVVVQ